ncbi:MAG: alpha-1,3-galactosidase-related protein [Sphingobacteriaceae bacterium]
MNLNHITSRFLTVSLVLLSFTAIGNATVAYDTIRITDFGAKPNSRVNAVLAVQNALKACKQKKNPVLVFPKGRYDFWPQHAIQKVYYESNTTDNNPKTNGILIEEMNNLIIDGNGSSFIYHGTMQPFTIDRSTNIGVKNLRIDWEFPKTGQGEIIDTASSYIDVKIDESQYPFEIENGKLMFVGEGWKSGIWIIMEYERNTHIIAPQTGDDPALGKGWQKYNAKRMGNGVVRLTHDFKRKPKPGNILIFRHSPRDHAAMFIQNSKDIKLESIEINHCAGLGILSQYSENLDFRKINFIPNAEKDRYFSGHDDAMHFSGCKGSIVVDSCRYAGLMDDPINIHGTYVKIIEKRGNNKLLCRFMEHMSVGMEWARAGEEVAYINNESLQTIGKATVAGYKQLSPTDFEITFTSNVPDNIKIANGLENLTWTPSATITNSSFESCRARGILVSTPKKVVIENNVFSSSGSAILIAGDVNSWYESGVVTDLLIKGNKFLSSTMTSNYQFCEAIISLYPEVPVMNEKTPTYHKNIRILDNEFHVYDYPVLFAQSINGLKFENNQLKRSYDFKPFHHRKASFSLIGCKDVTIKKNKIDRDLLGKNIKLEFMSEKEVKLSQPELHFEK